MHGRIANPKPLVDELPELRDQGRDLRIDACRGIALWCIFLDHIPNNIGSWLTLRNYGFSDAAEVFMFVSGVPRRKCEPSNRLTSGSRELRRPCLAAVFEGRSLLHRTLQLPWRAPRKRTNYPVGN
jgi:OpgC protein